MTKKNARGEESDENNFVPRTFSPDLRGQDREKVLGKKLG